MITRRRRPRIGLVLGGGAARGWAHIGAIRALHEAGVVPDVVCGTSIGALVGAVYANGDLDWLEDWVSRLTWQTVVRLLDLRLSGGLLGGKKVIQVFADRFNGCDIAHLKLPFAAVATELDSGRELWLQDGSVVNAVRASIAIPGIFTPVWHDGVWLVDGGLANPVPVSVARGMRADCVIAIDLNNDILNGRDFGALAGPVTSVPDPAPHVEPLRAPSLDAALERASIDAAALAAPHLAAELDAVSAADAGVGASAPDDLSGLAGAAPLLRRNGKPYPRWLQPAPGYEERDIKTPPEPSARVPSMLSSIAQSIDIMQVRLTRSRLAGEPADILIQPRLGGMGIFDFHRAAPAIAEGRAAVEIMLPAIKARLGLG